MAKSSDTEDLKNLAMVVLIVVVIVIVLAPEHIVKRIFDSAKKLFGLALFLFSLARIAIVGFTPAGIAVAVASLIISGVASDLLEGAKEVLKIDTTRAHLICRPYGGFSHWVVRAENCRKSAQCKDGTHFAHLDCAEFNDPRVQG